MPTQLLVWGSLLTIAAAGVTIFWDSMMRQRYRPTFAMATTVGSAAVICLMVLWYFHHCLTNQVTAMLVVFVVIVGVLCQLAIDKLNIDEQNSGLMSKWGTWWDGFNDNYLSNKFDSFTSYIVILVAIGALGYLAIDAHAADSLISDIDGKIAAKTNQTVVANESQSAQVAPESTNQRVEHVAHYHSAHSAHATKAHHHQPQ